MIPDLKPFTNDVYETEEEKLRMEHMEKLWLKNR